MKNINKQSRIIILIVCITVVFSLMVLPAFAGKGVGKSSTEKPVSSDSGRKGGGKGKVAPATFVNAPVTDIVFVADAYLHENPLVYGATDISNSNISWLYVYVTFENLTADTQLYVDLYSPDGYLYQTLNTAVLAGSADGYVNLPFGNGTWTSRLIGQWKAEVRFDNNSNVSGRDFFNLTD